MTEKKRFTYEYDEFNGNLFDNEYNTFYPIEDSESNLNLLCTRLNALVEENKGLFKGVYNRLSIKNLTDKLLYEYYQEIEKDLEKIINGPSLLARLSKYYHLASIENNIGYLLLFTYAGKIWIVREWNVGKFLNHINSKKQVELWGKSGLSIIRDYKND